MSLCSSSRSSSIPSSASGSSLTEKTEIVFTIKPRTFKIIANSYSIDYKDAEPSLTWYMDTSVCNPDLSTKYTSFFEPNYSCTFVGGDNLTDAVRDEFNEIIKKHPENNRVYGRIVLVGDEVTTIPHNLSGFSHF